MSVTALGSGTTGRDLIPGDAEGMWSDADVLRARGDAFADLAAAVGRVDTPAWTGSAADAFFGTRDNLRVKLQIAADCFLTASQALQQHAGVLAWAQRKAQDAIQRYRAASACLAPTPTSSGLYDLSPDTVGQQAAVEAVASLKLIVSRSARDTADLLNQAAEYGPGHMAPARSFIGALTGRNEGDSPWNGEGVSTAIAAPGPGALGSGALGAAALAARSAGARAASASAFGVPRATLGTSTTTNYRATFFRAYPDLRGQVWVHHAIERSTLTRYPGLVTESQMHSLQNLRGVPKPINAEVHLRQIRKEWNRFYAAHPPGTATLDDFLDFATRIDAKFGPQFLPPVRP